ncbi:MAG: HlyC/CorC family transporter [Spirochaetota bacterium]|nr:MAG: HlyC/CorC family transporter [Spirochaetota bacterium]
MDIIELAILCFLLVFSFIYSGSEVALFSISEVEKVKLSHNKDKKNLVLLKYLNYPERALITILIGNMAMNFSASIIGERLSHTFFANNPLFYSVFIMTFLILLFGEILPKNIAALHPNKFSKRFLGILEITRRIFFPLIYPISKIIGRSKGYKEHSNLSKEELLSAVEVSSDAGLDAISIKILRSLIGLIDRPVTDIMIPRADIVTIDLNDQWETIERLLHTYPFSSVIFSYENVDNIAGYVLKIDLIDARKGDIKSGLREPLFVPEAKTILSLLSDFKEQKKFIAIILDEYGGTSGLVTMKDLLDSIFIRDIILNEYIHKSAKGVWQIHGNTKITDVNTIVGLNLPTDANTIGNYVVNLSGFVPRTGYSISLDEKYNIKVKKSSDKFISLMELETIHD